MSSERREEGRITTDEQKEKFFGRDRATSGTEMEAGVPSSQGGRSHQWTALLLDNEQ